MNGDAIGNNAVCYKQLAPMGSGQVKEFTCNHELLGNWVSINKTDTEMGMEHLHFREIKVFGSR